MDNKSLEKRYDTFMNQLMAAKYHLLALGCKINNDEKSKLEIKINARRLENSVQLQLQHQIHKQEPQQQLQQQIFIIKIYIWIIFIVNLVKWKV